MPDIEVELARIEAVEGGIVREEDLRGALDGSETAENSDGEAATEAATEAPGEGAEEDAEPVDQSKVDYQLARALDLIRGVSVFGALKPAS
jgi:carboxyl-terminal processing protease